MRAIGKLGDLVAWTRAPEQSLGLHHLGDATVVRPERGDPMEIVDCFFERIRDTSEFHTLGRIAPAGEFVEVVRNRLDGDRLTATFVRTGALVDFIRERPERRERWRACIEAGAEVRRLDGTVPTNVLVLDETVLVAKTQYERGEPYTMIRSEDEAVRSWASEIAESPRADSERLDASAFGGPPAPGDDR